MEYKYKHHHEIKSLPLIINDAQDQKRALVQKIHAFDNLNYEKGSQKDDYLIRELIKGIEDDLDRYRGAIGLFDYGRNGDLKAYEDILIFFVKNFIDKFNISDKLKLLNMAIAEVEGKKKEVPLKYAGRDVIRKTNLYIVELHKKLKNFEIQLYDNFKPSLRKFLNDVNHILFFEKIIMCAKNIGLRGNFSGNAFNIEYLTNSIRSFILFNHKINMQECSDISLREFILNTLHDNEFEELWISRTGDDKKKLNEIINKIFLDIDSQLQQMEDVQCADDELLQAKSPGYKNKKSVLPARLKLIIRLKELLDDLSKMNACEEFSFPDEDEAIRDMERKEAEKYLFHVPGSSALSLKTIGIYMNNILTFVYSWMLRELYHQNLPYDLIAYLNNNLTYSDDFVKYYCTAVNVGVRKSSRKKLLLRSEIQYYIPKELAEKIINTMNKIHILLDNALISTYSKIPAATFTKKNDVLIKKMIIIYDHLNSMWKMIQDGLKSSKKDKA
jgi:hypothetical protein